MPNPVYPDPQSQKQFESWVEPPTAVVPLSLSCEVGFRRVLAYDGADTGLIEIILPPEICGKVLLRLPRSMFSDEVNGWLPEIPKRPE